jgi:hypothetical protein
MEEYDALTLSTPSCGIRLPNKCAERERNSALGIRAAGPAEDLTGSSSTHWARASLERHHKREKFLRGHEIHRACCSRSAQRTAAA